MQVVWNIVIMTLYLGGHIWLYRDMRDRTVKHPVFWTAVSLFFFYIIIPLWLLGRGKKVNTKDSWTPPPPPTLLPATWSPTIIPEPGIPLDRTATWRGVFHEMKWLRSIIDLEDSQRQGREKFSKKFLAMSDGRLLQRYAFPPGDVDPLEPYLFDTIVGVAATGPARMTTAAVIDVQTGRTLWKGTRVVATRSRVAVIGNIFDGAEGKYVHAALCILYSEIDRARILDNKLQIFRAGQKPMLQLVWKEPGSKLFGTLLALGTLAEDPGDRMVAAHQSENYATRLHENRATLTQVMTAFAAELEDVRRRRSEG